MRRRARIRADAHGLYVARAQTGIAIASLLSLVWIGCGARTGLEVPEAAREVEMDASLDAPDARVLDADTLDAPADDAGRDAPRIVDVPTDVSACPDVPVPLTRTDVETIFLIDGSGSMGTTWDGLPVGVGLPSRWTIVRRTLAEVLPPFDAQLALGAKVFPDDGGCEVGDGLDVSPHVGAMGEVLALFDRWVPEGGTPTAQALWRVLDVPTERPRVVVATLDGGPNCNPDTGAPPETCVCTGTRRACLLSPQNCLDSTATLEVVRTAYQERGVPVIVVGIDDPSRPDLSDFLDEMALAGGWARPVGSERRFYNAAEPGDLRGAFTEVADLIARCVYIAPRPPPEDAFVAVRLDGAPIARDPSHVSGWDWTDRAAGALALFGPACDAVRARDVEVTAEIVCAP